MPRPALIDRLLRLGGSFSARFWPAVLFLSYFLFTVVLFAFGPIDYPVTNPWKLYGFLAVSHVAFLLGYSIVILRGESPRIHTPGKWAPSIPTLVAVSSVLNIALLIPSTLFMTEGSLDVLSALKNPSAVYLRTSRIAEATTNPFIYPILMVAPILFLTVPLTLFFWRRLPLPHRFLGITAIAVIWAAGVMLGRNKGFADLFLLTLVILLAHLARSGSRARLGRWVAGGVLALTIFLLFFGQFKAGAAGRMPRSFTKGYVNAIDGYLDYDNIFLRPLPEQVKPGVGHLSNYLTQGYYGLALALQLEFDWTYGLGNSHFLHKIEERILGGDFAKTNCYPARVEREFGYSMYRSWHTVYPWWASDLSFSGTLVAVFLIGGLLAIVWQETLIGENPFSIAMFANISIMLFYFNANNQALGFPVQFSTTMGLLVLWLLTRKRYAGAEHGGSPTRPAPTHLP